MGRDLVPWNWGLYFNASELILRDSITIEPDFREGADPSEKEVRKRRVIHGKLQPSRVRYDQTSYSMLGTDRTITDIQLVIDVWGGEDPQERCTAWGGVSYTFDADFRDETIDDCLIFHLYVLPEEFDRYAEMIAAASIDQATFRVSRVFGFYSDWSPSISTSSIKVLTHEKEHEVEVPAGCEIDPPRLGLVDEASFEIHCINKFELAVEEDEWVDDADLPTQQPQTAEHLPPMPKGMIVDERAIGLLSSLRFAAWAIAALLVVLIITSR